MKVLAPIFRDSVRDLWLAGPMLNLSPEDVIAGKTVKRSTVLPWQQQFSIPPHPDDQLQGMVIPELKSELCDTEENTVQVFSHIHSHIQMFLFCFYYKYNYIL